MAIIKRAFWDPISNREYDVVSDVKTMAEVIKELEDRIKALEEAYMEEKLLGKTEEPGKIES